MRRFESGGLQAAEKRASRKEELERVDSLHGDLKELIKEEAASLRDLGFPVDDEIRVEMSVFGGVGHINDARLAADRQEIRYLEQELRRREREAGVEIRDKSGELLEMVKTVGMNRLWSGGRFIAVRTSKFDDYENGVDNLLFDTMTNTPIAAFDEAAGGSVFQKNPERLLRNLTEGAKVRYGLEYDDGRITKKSYEDDRLPLFIIRASLEELCVLAEDIKKNEVSERGADILRTIFGNLGTQAGAISQRAKPEVRKRYEAALATFSEISETLSEAEILSGR